QECGRRHDCVADVALCYLDECPLDASFRRVVYVGTSLGFVILRAGGYYSSQSRVHKSYRSDKSYRSYEKAGGIFYPPTQHRKEHAMSRTTSPVDVKSAEDHLMRFLTVEGLSGQEKAIGNAVCDELKKVGVPASAIRFDKVHERIPVPTQTGNLFVDLPGTRKGPRLLFITHLDTVALCAGAKPKREGDRIVSDGT